MAMAISGRLVLAGTLLAVGVLATGCRYGFNAESNQATDDTALNQSISEVHVDSGAGDVSVQVGSTASVHRIVHYADSKPGSSQTVAGGVLTLNDCGENCTADYVVTLPANAKVDGGTSSGNITVSGASSVDVQASSGDVSVEAATGSVSVTSSSGDIKIASAGADVQAKSSSGDIAVNGVTGTVSLQTSSGKLQATGTKGASTTAHGNSGDIVVSPAVAQNLDLQSTSGDITVTAPGRSYKVNVPAGSGDHRIGIPTDPNGQFTITASANSGDVKISAAS
ncbi:MAG TPA: DUF4097 family beta strand repeat-containing protein [Pseudonocardiaceae bacterium]|jgi:DUF4097 and DUF4098 domain-containing protein YvlB